MSFNELIEQMVKEDLKKAKSEKLIIQKGFNN